jgi:hypothetical protein
MTARAARTLSSLVAVVLTAACTSYFEIPIETPIRPKLDVSPFQRVLVAGFISGGSEDVDGNTETTRLLRSQLRTKSELRVIDADTLPLVEVASENTGRPAGDNVAATVVLPAAIREDKDLEPYEHLFADVEYWKRIGDEYQQPLIVTGTIMFTPKKTAGMVTRDRETFDSVGRRIVQPQRVYMERSGFVLKPRFIFIDGRTGAVLHSENFSEEVLYSQGQATPPLSSYFELMDRLLPIFLNTLSSQTVKGTRILLQ